VGELKPPVAGDCGARNAPRNAERTIMRRRCGLGAWVLAAAGLAVAAAGARADDTNYPDIAGTWMRPGAAQWDPTKPAGLRQQAPLTAEYQAVFEGNLRATAAGGQEYNPQVNCMPAGMPRLMIAYDQLEFIITPEITYIRSDHLGENRRIYTDGRDWPEQITPKFEGYSIGQWVEPDGRGRYGALAVETRGLKGPRALDASGLPLHADNQTIVKERFFIDGANHNLLHDQITTIDHAYRQPWTVTRDYNRVLRPVWIENNCGAENHYVEIEKETYFISADGYLMPTKKNQRVPDLKNFDQPAR
jgi:hypothetical protein